MSNIRDTATDAGQAVAGAAKKAVEFVEDETGLGCGSSQG